MEILLQKNEVIDLSKLPKRHTLKCLSGCLWVTRQGDLKDYLLAPGKSFTLSGHGKLAAMAMTDVRFCIYQNQKEGVALRAVLQA